MNRNLFQKLDIQTLNKLKACIVNRQAKAHKKTLTCTKSGF